MLQNTVIKTRPITQTQDVYNETKKGLEKAGTVSLDKVTESVILNFYDGKTG